MINVFNKPGQVLKKSENHVCKYELLCQTEDYEVIKQTISKGSLTIIQTEECLNNTNSYYVLTGKMKCIHSDEIFDAGSSFVFRDLEEARVFQTLEYSELIWTAKDSVFDKLVPENDIILDTLNLIHEKDHYTKNHSLRVSELAKMLAVKAKLTGRQISDITIAALSHDLGKIDIEDHILNKKSKLNNQEYKRIQEHVLLGFDKIKHTFSKSITDIVVQHHERFNGSGYPYGLSKENICLGAKILAIADSYDAMNTVRPYKTAMHEKAIIEELRNCKDLYYDSDLVELFIDMIQNKEHE